MTVNLRQRTYGSQPTVPTYDVYLQRLPTASTYGEGGDLFNSFIYIFSLINFNYDVKHNGSQPTYGRRPAVGDLRQLTYCR